jgi:hypothetical protein
MAVMAAEVAGVVEETLVFLGAGVTAATAS